MQTEERSYESTLDLPELMARVEHDHELLREVLEIYKAEFPILHLQLTDALERGDMGDVRVTAHTLKGMLASLSFGQATTSAMRIERMAADFALQEIRPELIKLERSAALAQANLESVCREVLR